MKITIGKGQRVSLNILFSIFFWIILFCIYFFNQKEQDSVIFLDIGQGDATLVQQGDIQILIDGGADRSVLYELPKYMSFFDRDIEYLILTHPHDDHMVGFLHILENYNVGVLLYFPVCNTNSNYETLLSNPVQKREISKGETIRLGYIDMKVLWPPKGELNEQKCYKSWDGNINNDSLVLEFTYLNKDFLLMADAEKEVENILLSEVGVLNRYDILKAGHHCAKTSNSETFLQQVGAPLAICSCGYGNKYGHPNGETLKNFDKLNVQYLVTYEEGNIVIKD